MQSHLLVTQLRFARREFVRCLEGVSEADAQRRLLPMNCISWMVGHLANQEHRYWVIFAQGKDVAPGLYDLVGYGKPASTPALADMWAVWHKVTAAADSYLDTLTPEKMTGFLLRDGKPVDESIGTLLMRNLYHYWYHTGEASAVRQMLGHANVPEFVGDFGTATYHPEAG
ncbi:MAG TPA: DinB family protein [Anaerolineales bacterium]|nr:DinB family protein [Anaerolineales bacterium]